MAKEESLVLLLLSKMQNIFNYLNICFLSKKLSGKLYADRGYISQVLQDILSVDGIHFLTKMRNNMKGGEIPLQERIYLHKRAIIGTVYDKFKNNRQIGHTRHLSFTNFISNLVA